MKVHQFCLRILMKNSFRSSLWSNTSNKRRQSVTHTYTEEVRGGGGPVDSTSLSLSGASPLSLPPTPPSLLIRPAVMDKPVGGPAERKPRARTRPVFWLYLYVFVCLFHVVSFACPSPGLLNFSRENQNHMGSIHQHKPKFLPVRKNVCLVNSCVSSQMIVAHKQSHQNYLSLLQEHFNVRFSFITLLVIVFACL